MVEGLWCCIKTCLITLQGGLTCLYLASQGGYMDVVKKLLKAGADTNTINQVSELRHYAPFKWFWYHLQSLVKLTQRNHFFCPC